MRNIERLSTVSLPPVVNIQKYVRSSKSREDFQSFITEKISGFTLQNFPEQFASM
jgi:hypothetical protein